MSAQEEFILAAATLKQYADRKMEDAEKIQRQASEICGHIADRATLDRLSVDDLRRYSDVIWSIIGQ